MQSSNPDCKVSLLGSIVNKVELHFHCRHLSFVLNLQPEHCDFLKFFDEGVEVSVGNWDNNGQWIPLMYFTNSLNRSTHDIKVGESDGAKVKIRGYTVPFLVQNTTDPLRVNLTVCGESVVRRGLQIRWLQTTSLYVATSYEVKDTWTLNAVYTSFPSCALKNSTDNSSNSMRWV